MATLSMENLWKSKDKVKPVTGTPGTDSPLGAAFAGANDQAAKMAGTPAATKSSTEQILATPKGTDQGGSTLTPAGAPVAPSAPETALGALASTGRNYADAMRTMRPDLVNATVEEEARKLRLENEAMIGSLKLNSQDMIKAATGKAGETFTAPTQAGLSQTQVADIIAGKLDVAGNQNLMQMIPNLSDADLDKIVEAAQGITADGNPNLKAAADAAQAAIKEKTLKVIDGLGDKIDKNVIASTLDISVEDLGNYCPTKLANKLQEIIDKDTELVETNRKLVSDPSVSAAERTAASRTLLRQGALGLRTISEEVKELGDNLATFDDITVAGKTYDNLEALLASDAFGSLITISMGDDEEAAAAALVELEKNGLYTAGLSQRDTGKKDEQGNPIYEWVKTTKNEEGEDEETIVDPSDVPLMNKYNKTMADIAKDVKDQLGGTAYYDPKEGKWYDKKGGTETVPGIADIQKLVLSWGKIDSGGNTINGAVMSAFFPSYAEGKILSAEELKNGQTFFTSLQNLKPGDLTRAVADLNALAAGGHENLLKDMFKLKGENLIAKNLKYLRKSVTAFETKEAIDNLNVSSIGNDWTSLNVLVKNGYISQEDMDFYREIGMKPSSILRDMQEDFDKLDVYDAATGSGKAFVPSVLDSLKVGVDKTQKRALKYLSNVMEKKDKQGYLVYDKKLMDKIREQFAPTNNKDLKEFDDKVKKFKDKVITNNTRSFTDKMEKKYPLSTDDQVTEMFNIPVPEGMENRRLEIPKEYFIAEYAKVASNLATEYSNRINSINRMLDNKDVYVDKKALKGLRKELEKTYNIYKNPAYATNLYNQRMQVDVKEVAPQITENIRGIISGGLDMASELQDTFKIPKL